MGIQGLLPFLKKIHSPVNVSQYSGCTVAIDAYCWLHRGAFSCADKLAMGEKTDQYVFYCMKYVNYLLSKDIKPILVFDGQHLPSKRDVERSRRERRELNRKKAAQFLREGKRAEAKDCFQKCVDISPEMALELMKACRNRGVDCIVAPYEADAQLAYLNKAGIAQLVITEDSDLLLFGCDKVLFKMDFYGNGMLIDTSRLNEVVDMRENYTFEKFRYMCILSGCDYLPSLPGIGLAKACKVFKTARQPDLKLVLKKISSYLNSKIAVTDEYIDGFIQANNTFLYQLSFDPRERRLVPLTPYPPGVEPDQLEYAGSYFSPRKAVQIALGNWNIYSDQMMSDFNPDQPQPAQQKSRNKQNFLSQLSIWDRKYRPAGQIRPLKEVQAKDKHERGSTAGKERVIDSNLLKHLPLKRSREDAEKEEKLAEGIISDTYGEKSDSKRQKITEEEYNSGNSDSEHENLDAESSDNSGKVDKRQLWEMMQQENKENSSQGQPTVTVTPRRKNKFAVSPQSEKKERFNINAVVGTPTVKTEVKSQFFKSQSKLSLKVLSSGKEGSRFDRGDNPDVKSEYVESDLHVPAAEGEGSCFEENPSVSQQILNSLEQKINKSTEKISTSSLSQGRNSPSAFSWSKFKFSKQCRKSLESKDNPVQNNSKLNKPFKQLIVSSKEEPSQGTGNLTTQESEELVTEDEMVCSKEDSEYRESGYFSSSMDCSASQSTCISQDSLGRAEVVRINTVDLTDMGEDEGYTAQESRFAAKSQSTEKCSTLTKEAADSLTVSAPLVKTPSRSSSACRVSGLSRGRGKNSSLTKHSSMPSGGSQSSIKNMFAKFAHKTKSADRITH